MKKQSRTMKSFAGVNLADLPYANAQAARMTLYPLEAWLQWQASMLNAAAPAMADWIERRREGTDAALKTVARLATCDDVSDASQIQREWLEGEMARLQSDMRALGQQAFLWSQESVKASQSAAQAVQDVAAAATTSDIQEAA